MGKRLTYQEVKEFIESNGCKLLSTEYVNNNTKLLVQCACGEVFEVRFHDFKTKNQRQCSKCGKEILKRKLKGEKVKFICEWCGKESEQNPSAYAKSKNHFCSVECKCNWTSKNKSGKNNALWDKVKCNCDNCGEEMLINRYKLNQKNHFCSQDCKAKWQTKNRKGKDNPLWKRVEVICDYCGEKVLKKPSDCEGHEHHFCGDECKKSYNRENPKCGKDSYRWNPNLTDEEREKGRHYTEYPIWRKDVFERDNYTCQCCKKRGSETFLNSHHLNGYNWDKEHRTSKLNGITLCKKCHNEFHSIHGKGNNTIIQFRDFIYKKYLQTNDPKYLTILKDIDIRITLLVDNLTLSLAN